jgi:hypothetical protein
MAHRDDLADNIPLAECLDHPDEGQKYFYDAPNQPNFYPLGPDPGILFYLSFFHFRARTTPMV